MVSKQDRNEQRLKRHRRVRGTVSGTPARPRLDVFRSAKHIYAQIIDDVAGKTLVSASSAEKAFEGTGGNKQGAREIGKLIGERSKSANVSKVVFDRGGSKYHGKVKALADAAREVGLDF